MARVFIPAQLRQLVHNQEQIDVEGATLGEVITRLDQVYPGVKERLCPNDALAPGWQVSIDHVLSTRGLRAKLRANTEVHFLPFIGGG